LLGFSFRQNWKDQPEYDWGQFLPIKVHTCVIKCNQTKLFYTQVQSFIPGYETTNITENETTYLGMKLHTWVWNYIPGLKLHT
jgi:hypothetical protein